MKGIYIFAALVVFSLLVGFLSPLVANVPFLGPYAQVVHNWLLGLNIKLTPDTIAKGVDSTKPLWDSFGELFKSSSFWIVITVLLVVFFRKQLFGFAKSETSHILLIVAIGVVAFMAISMKNKIPEIATWGGLFITGGILVVRLVGNATGWAENLGKMLFGGVTRSVFILLGIFAIPAFSLAPLGISVTEQLNLTQRLSTTNPATSKLTETIAETSESLLRILENGGKQAGPVIGSLVALGALIALLLVSKPKPNGKPK